jgi:hypothetical protein
MTTREILEAIHAAGAALHLVDDEILIETAAPIAPELLAEIRQRKTELLTLVSTVERSTTTTDADGRETPHSTPEPVPMPPESVDSPCRVCRMPMVATQPEGPAELRWSCSACGWWIICATFD